MVTCYRTRAQSSHPNLGREEKKSTHFSYEWYLDITTNFFPNYPYQHKHEVIMLDTNNPGHFPMDMGYNDSNQERPVPRGLGIPS
jgi:hypothetical protein